jgi:hypothetical protein
MEEPLEKCLGDELMLAFQRKQELMVPASLGCGMNPPVLCRVVLLSVKQR